MIEEAVEVVRPEVDGIDSVGRDDFVDLVRTDSRLLLKKGEIGARRSAADRSIRIVRNRRLVDDAVAPSGFDTVLVAPCLREHVMNVNPVREKVREFDWLMLSPITSAIAHQERVDALVGRGGPAPEGK